jgi:hypothetical protein
MDLLLFTSEARRRCHTDLRGGIANGLSRRRADTDASVNAWLHSEADQDHKPDASVVLTVIR